MAYHQPALRTAQQVGPAFVVWFEQGTPPSGGAGPPAPVLLTIPAGASSATFAYRNHTPGTYILVATPGAGPLSGKGACNAAEAVIRPTGLTINNMLAVTQAGEPPILYVSRTDTANVAIIDVLTDGVSVANALYQTHTAFLPDQTGSTVRLKCSLVRVFGTGSLTSGTLTVTPDTQASRAVTVDATKAIPASGQPERNEQVLLLYAPNPAQVGWQFDVTLNLTGTGLVVKDVQFECEIV